MMFCHEGCPVAIFVACLGVYWGQSSIWGKGGGIGALYFIRDSFGILPSILVTFYVEFFALFYHFIILDEFELFSMYQQMKGYIDTTKIIFRANIIEISFQALFSPSSSFSSSLYVRTELFTPG